MNKTLFFRHLVDRPTSLMLFCIANAGLLALLTLAGCGNGKPVEESPEQPGRPVRVVEAQTLNTAETLRVPAALRASQRARLAFLQAGYLADRLVERGQLVRTGEVLATLHNPALQPGVAAAEAQLNEARSRLAQLERDTERLSELVERDLISDDELEQTRASRDVARASLKQSRARLDQARNQLLDASLRAPFDGHIVELMLEPGDFAAPGQPILSIHGTGSLEIELQLPGRYAGNLARGEVIHVVRVNDGRSISAELAEIGRAEPGRAASVIARLDETLVGEWRAGDAVYAELEMEGVEILSVPLTSIVSPGTRSSRLFRVREQKAEMITVETGRTVRGWVQITGPLEPGDQIIIAGQAQLLDGDTVRIID